jgi:hypothetical protein
MPLFECSGAVIRRGSDRLGRVEDGSESRIEFELRGTDAQYCFVASDVFDAPPSLCRGSGALLPAGERFTSHLQIDERADDRFAFTCKCRQRETHAKLHARRLLAAGQS